MADDHGKRREKTKFMKQLFSGDDRKPRPLNFRNRACHQETAAVCVSGAIRESTKEFGRRHNRFSIAAFTSWIFLYALGWVGAANGDIVVNIGNGSDGDLFVTNEQTVTWGVATHVVSTQLTVATQTNQVQITVGNTSGFNTNDELLLYVYQADDATGAAGQYETFHVASIPATNLLVLDHAPSAIYNPSEENVTAQRVPNFGNVTICTNGTLAAQPWNGTSGGIIFFRAQGTLNIFGTLTAAGDGFSGGGSPVAGTSWSLDGSGSAGAADGGGGSLDADPTFQHLFLGSGGGGGNSSSLGAGGNGGAGGGLIYATAYTINMTGSINVSGANESGGGFGAVGGGGGSGGEAWLQCWNALGMTSINIDRNGGLSAMPDHGIPGNAGGPGLRRLDFHYGWVPYAGVDTHTTVDSVSLSPVILAQPQNVMGSIGSTASFSVQAFGASPISYQWQFNGVNLVDNGQIAGSQSNILTIAGVQPGDAGNFQVVISNAYGSIISTSATVTGAFPPSIFHPPLPQTVAAGSSLALGVLADGAPPLSYQWQNSAGAIAGQTNSSLIFNPALTNYTDNYSVIVSNLYGAVTSQVAAVVVYVPVTNQLLVVNVGDGSDGDLFVQTNVTWGSATYAVSTPLAMPTTNANQIVVGDSVGFEPGDEVLLYVYQATTNVIGAAGQYETFHIGSVEGINFLTLDRAPSALYDTSQEKVLVQRVPNFNNVTIYSNAILSAPPWNGISGGIIFFRAQATLNIAGTVNAAGAGFPGGVTLGGEAGGVNGASWCLDCIGSGGAGGGVNGPGGGGSLDADPTFKHLFLGSGGGGGGGDSFGGGDSGGAGGGLVYAAAYSIGITGGINVSGVGGGGGIFGSGGGGGGSGGEVWLQCWNSLDATCYDINRNGGPGTMPDHGTPAPGGGPGLSRLDFQNNPGACTGTDQTNMVNEVSLSPIILIQPQSLVEFVGATATFAVQAIGDSPLSYQWQFNGTNLADGGRINGSQSNLLTISGVQLRDAGNYQVVISNQVIIPNASGSVTSAVATLTVVPQLNPAGASIVSFGFYPGLTIHGTLGYSVVIQRSANLANTNGWVTLTNLTLTQPTQVWVDASVDASSSFNPIYFYRILPAQ